MSADVTDLTMSFDQAHDYLTTWMTLGFGLSPLDQRRAVRALLAELDRRDQVIQSQAAALDEAHAVQDRARDIVREATQVIEDQRRQILEMEEALAAHVATALRVHP